MPKKNEEDIQREKDAVSKMVGAKAAMEAALRRIERLEHLARHLDGRLSYYRHESWDRIFVRRDEQYCTLSHDIAEMQASIRDLVYEAS